MPSIASVSRRVVLSALAGATALAAFSAPAAAQDFPSKPIRILVLTGTGTVSDMVARLLAARMAKPLGQSIVVENLPSGGGIVGTGQLARSAKDGHTLALLNNNHVINPSVYKNLPYDTLKDITPIGTIGSTPLVLAINPNVPAKNLNELLTLARAKPGALSYGSAGNGTVLHLAGVLLTSEANVDILHVPYKASSQMLTDAISGQVDMIFGGVAMVAGHIETGKLRAIGVTTKQRSQQMQNVPTLAEQALGNYDFDGWMALAGPGGLPSKVVDRLNAELNATLALPEVQESMTKMAIMIKTSTPEQAARFFQSELEKHTTLAERGGAKLN